jgi:hypothetical protein
MMFKIGTISKMKNSRLNTKILILIKQFFNWNKYFLFLFNKKIHPSQSTMTLNYLILSEMIKEEFYKYLLTLSKTQLNSQKNNIPSSK